MTKYYEVVARIYSDGRCECDEPRAFEADKMPESTIHEGDACDTWKDYFEDEGEARNFADGYKFA